MAADPNARRDKTLEGINRELQNLIKVFEVINANLVQVGRTLDRALPKLAETEGSDATE